MSDQNTRLGFVGVLAATTKSRTTVTNFAVGAAAATSANAVDVPIVHAWILSAPLAARTTFPNWVKNVRSSAAVVYPPALDTSVKAVVPEL